ncbi:MAG TPA: 50S ribosomal protein L1 [Chloroflexi bacterium]|nr:50S ribosomal protein L1 [Chloroflexota bacterium]
MPKHGRKYLESLKEIDRDRLYEPREALELAKKVAKANFDETIEVHMRLGIDPRKAEQQIRGAVVLPAGLGKTVRILVFAEGDAARIAEQAGADIVASDEIIEKIEKEGFTDFDIAIAVPEMMRKIGRLGRVLGPRGLMPSPKSGTLVQMEDLPRVIEEARAGRVEYRNDRTGNLHVPIGKASFEVDDLLANFATVMDAIRRARPPSVKGAYVRKLVVAPTMGPGIKVDPNLALMLEAPK